ncbi:hypothetical protein H6P81_006582 [Aristolochia fimbriata]|uniref:Neprosin PEP catalytic domain-containing protein n=1 Tax=Aristolochia fimbriata TaxID=158543 RepID=A0AAV7F286_ARIFI|nr:hypothetical protein H6P81_006582 [Aristolochia fimbriata]
MARLTGLVIPSNHAKLLCLALFMFLGLARSLSSFEYLEMKKLLKSLNKPAVKSIETRGDIFDCVDIYKQPAFDHPLLKNYTIPKEPTSPPKIKNSLEFVSSNASLVDIKLPDGGCPEGTVPIKRVQMKDLLRARSISDFGKKRYMNGSFNPANALPSYHHWAKIDTKHGDYYGASAHINVWKPGLVMKADSSSAQFWLVSGSDNQLNTIEAGWLVYQELFGDLEPRIFIYWTSDNYGQTGCFNTLCSGFVSVHRRVPLGTTFQRRSIRDGKQFEFTVSVWKDIAQWWLYINDEVVGFWPEQIFSHLNRKAEKAMWGGEVYNPEPETPGTVPYLPPMGSGSYAGEGWQKACFMNRVFVANDKNQYVDAPTDTTTFIDKPMCYDAVDRGMSKDPNWRRNIYFGGPGGRC